MIRVTLIYCVLLLACGVAVGGQVWNTGVVERHIQSLQKADGESASYMVSSSLPDFRRKQLEERLDKLVDEQFSENFEFEVKESSVDDDIAMAVVVVSDQENPLFFESIALAFCRDEGIWKATPVLGRYAMTGVGGYNPAVMKSRELLEDWGEMRSRFYRDIGRKELDKRFKQQVNSHRVVNSALRGDSQEDAMLYFMRMCRERNFSGVLACISNKGEEVAEYETVIQGFKRQKSSWYRLLKKNYSYGVLSEIEDSEIVSVGCYFPDEEVTSQIFEFGVDKENGCWRVYLPSCLELKPDGVMDEGRFRSYKLEEENKQRLPMVFKSVLKNMASSAIVSVEKHRANFLHAIQQDDFQTFANLAARPYSAMHKGGDMTPAEFKKRQRACTQLWMKVRGENVEELAEISTDEYSIQFLLVYPASRPASYEILTLFSIKGTQGWGLIPEFKPSRETVEGVIPAKVIEVSLAKEKELHQEVLNRWLDGVVELSSVKMLPIRDSVTVESFYGKYQNLLINGDVEGSSRFLACDDGARGELIEVIGREMRGRQSSLSSYSFSEVLLSETMALVVVELGYQDKAESEYLAYPYILSKKHGGRILPNYLYYYQHGRGQIALNALTLKSVKSSQSDDFYKEFISLVDSFNIKIKEKLDDDSE